MAARIQSHLSEHGEPESRRRVGFRAKLGIYLLFLAVYLTGASGHFYSTDHVSVYLTTQSLVEAQNVTIKPILDTAQGRNGASYSVFGVGQSVAAIPLYLTGKAVNHVSSPRGREYFRGPYLRDWGGTVPIFFVSLFNQLVAPLLCVLVFMFLLRLGFSAGVSFFTTLLFGLGSAVFVAAHEFFQHPLEALMLLGSIYVLFDNRDRLRERQALFAGSIFAFGLLTRVNLVIAAPALLVYVAAISIAGRGHAIADGLMPVTLPARAVDWLQLRRVNGDVLRCVGAFLLPTVLAFTIMFYLNYGRFGNVFTFNQTGAHGFFWSSAPVGVYGYLLSPGRSIFLYSPPALLGLFAARTFYERHRPEALLFAGIAVTYVLFYSSYDAWHGGWAWGPRYLLPVVPLMIIPSAYLFQNRAAVAAAVALAVLGFGIQILGTVVNVSYVTSTHWMGAPGAGTDNSFLFVPGISPVPTHLKDLLHNRNVDLWLLYVRQAFGTGAMLMTLAVPASILAVSAVMLRDLWPSRHRPGLSQEAWPEGSDPATRPSVDSA